MLGFARRRAGWGAVACAPERGKTEQKDGQEGSGMLGAICIIRAGQPPPPGVKSSSLASSAQATHHSRSVPQCKVECLRNVTEPTVSTMYVYLMASRVKTIKKHSVSVDGVLLVINKAPCSCLTYWRIPDDNKSFISICDLNLYQ